MTLKEKLILSLLGLTIVLALVLLPVRGNLQKVWADDLSDRIKPVETDMEDGEYSIGVDVVGGSGKAGVSTPALMIVEDGKAYARLVWSSSYYDYMVIDGVKYLNEAEEESNSTFTIPVTAMDQDISIIADTTAMGTPHEVEYILTFHSDEIGDKGDIPQEAAKKVVVIALVIIVGGGILNHFVKKKLRA